MLPLFLFIIAFACEKATQPQQPPSVLQISGFVTDKQTGNPLDSVSVSLNHNTGSIGSPSIPQMTLFTGIDGKFNFQFSSKDNYSYSVFFDKTGAGYKWISKSIDRNKEHQEFNVTLEK